VDVIHCAWLFLELFFYVFVSFFVFLRQSSYVSRVGLEVVILTPPPPKC
jgi:hypothetical protein